MSPRTRTALVRLALIVRRVDSAVRALAARHDARLDELESRIAAVEAEALTPMARRASRAYRLLMAADVYGLRHTFHADRRARKLRETGMDELEALALDLETER